MHLPSFEIVGVDWQAHGCGQSDFDSHEKPRFCPQPYTDGHSEQALTAGKPSVSSRGCVLVKNFSFANYSVCSLLLPQQNLFIVRALLSPARQAGRIFVVTCNTYELC